MDGQRRRDAEAELNLPPGFRFHPTDAELVVDYLVRKASGQRLPVPIIAEVDLYKFDPWDLPELALFGKREWYFFTPRDRKYQNGSRPNRSAGRGYWKATGADKPVSAPGGSGRTVGIKKALVFYHGKAPRGVKTDWIMHEYRLADVDRSASNKNGSLRLDDCVLCRLYNKKNNWAKMQQNKNQLQVASAAKTSASVETTDEPRSDSPWTTSDSDLEQDSFFDLDDPFRQGKNHSQPSQYSQGLLQQGQINVDASSFQIADEAKEEGNDWFTDLNLDDFLQSSSWAGLASSASAVDASNLDYSLQNQSNHMAQF